MIESFIKNDEDRYIIKSASIVNNELRLDCGHRGVMHITLTSNEYNSLYDTDKMNGTIYYEKDENKFYLCREGHIYAINNINNLIRIDE